MIVVVAEGAVKGGVMKIAEEVKNKYCNYEIRISVLGRIQRGGNPSCFDRVLASRLGYEAIEAYLKGKENIMVGLKNNKITYTTFAKASSGKHNINKKLLLMAKDLST